MKSFIGKIQLRIFGVLLLIMALLIMALMNNADLKTLILGGLAGLAVLFAALLRWINRPLRLLAKSLRTHDASVLDIGVFHALGCFGVWGLFPIYFKLLDQVPALEVVAHRILWSVVVLLALILAQGRWPLFQAEFRNPRRLGFYLLTTLLISTNWLIYIWAVQHGRMLEASLGYYINPLVNVLLGVLFLRERLNQRQWMAIALAAFGVLILIIGYGVVPWIALSLALSFGSYGMLRKKAAHAATLGLGVETVLLAPVALLFLVVQAVRGAGAFGAMDGRTDLLLMAAGLITVAPLLMFLEATRLLRLSTVGLIQYMTPTLQFLLAVLLYRELFTAIHLAAFSCIWLALALYSMDAWSTYQHRADGAAAPDRGAAS